MWIGIHVNILILLLLALGQLLNRQWWKRHLLFYFKDIAFCSWKNIQHNIVCRLNTECFGKAIVSESLIKFTWFLPRALNTERNAGLSPCELWNLKWQCHFCHSGLGKRLSSVVTSLILATWNIATENNFYPGLKAPAHNCRYLAGWCRRLASTRASCDSRLCSRQI